jgi:ABC-type spermidine/putrescine transport system permease subunit II
MEDVRFALRDALRGWHRVTTGVGMLLGVFLLLPVLVIVPLSFTSSGFPLFPPPLVSSRWYDLIATDPAWTSAFKSSLQLTWIGGAIATVAGTCAALALRRRPGTSLGLTTWFLVPLVIPWIVYAIGLYLVFDDLSLLGEPWAIAAGQAVLAFPLVFVTVSAGLGRIPDALPSAAASLGSRWYSVVRDVEVPLVRASIAGAALFALAHVFDETVVALFLTRADNQTLPVQIFQSTRDSLSPAIAAASTVVMTVAVLAFGTGSRLIAGRRGRHIP